MSEHEDRLARWSRLKSEAAVADAELPAVEPSAQISAEEAIAALPKLEEIDAATDIRGFLHDGVPQALRAAALSRAWLADPAIRNRIPDAIDYAEDYNAPHTISGWGPACPDEAGRAVARLHAPEPVEVATSDPPNESVKPVRAAKAQADARSATERSQIEDGASEPAPVMVAQTAPIEKNPRRHGGAMPLDD